LIIYDILFILQYIPSVNYCDGLGRWFRLVCIYACAVVFDATVFSVNKDLYIPNFPETSLMFRPSNYVRKARFMRPPPKAKDAICNRVVMSVLLSVC